MERGRGRRSVAAVWLIGAAALLPLAPALTAQEVRQQGDIRFVSGGNTELERQALQALVAREEMSLKLIFTDTRETFVSPVAVTIMDGESVILDTTSTGPWLCARLPVGEYQIRAIHRGTVREASMTVPAEGRKEIVITYPWSPKE